jgi:hypothetical protein
VGNLRAETPTVRRCNGGEDVGGDRAYDQAAEAPAGIRRFLRRSVRGRVRGKGRLGHKRVGLWFVHRRAPAQRLRLGQHAAEVRDIFQLF